MMKNQNGFTLIELVLVIIVLGILSATAMPRFVNLSDDAKSATYKSISSSLQASVNLVHMKWGLDGKPTNDDYQVDDIDMNVYGYPQILNGIPGCVAIFSKLLPGSEAVPEENIVVFGSVVHGGNVCAYKFEKNNDNNYLYSITYDEDSGKVEFKEGSSVRN